MFGFSKKKKATPPPPPPPPDPNLGIAHTWITPLEKHEHVWINIFVAETACHADGEKKNDPVVVDQCYCGETCSYWKSDNKAVNFFNQRCYAMFKFILRPPCPIVLDMLAITPEGRISFDLANPANKPWFLFSYFNFTGRNFVANSEKMHPIQVPAHFAIKPSLNLNQIVLDYLHTGGEVTIDFKTDITPLLGFEVATACRVAMRDFNKEKK